jgi:hypothetical protein
MAETLGRSFRARTRFASHSRGGAPSLRSALAPGYYIPAPLALKKQTIPQLQLVALPNLNSGTTKFRSQKSIQLAMNLKKK